MLILRPVRPEDAPEWLRMRRALWPEADPAELAAEVRQHPRPPAADAIFVLERPEGGLGGFLEAGTRPWAEGCETGPVAYIEGWYVDPDLRGGGLGRRLVEAAEAWAREQGCREIASDCELWNEESRLAHMALGYAEAARIICFCKKLP